MKLLSLILSLVIMSTTNAETFGNFKVSFDFEQRGTPVDYAVEFQLNGMGKIRIIKNPYKAEVTVQKSSEEVKLFVKSGSEEAWIESIFVLKNNMVIKNCSARVNELDKTLEPFVDGSINLSRWDKNKREYEYVYADRPIEVQKECFSELLNKYIHFFDPIF